MLIRMSKSVLVIGRPPSSQWRRWMSWASSVSSSWQRVNSDTEMSKTLYKTQTYLRFHSSEPVHPLSHRWLISIKNQGSSDRWKWHQCRGSAAARRTPCYSPQTEQWHRQQGFCPLVDTVMRSCRTLEAGNQNMLQASAKWNYQTNTQGQKKPQWFWFYWLVQKCYYNIVPSEKSLLTVALLFWAKVAIAGREFGAKDKAWRTPWW